MDACVQLGRLDRVAMGPVERNKLLDVIWGLDAFPTNRTVDNHIVSIRRKIEKDAKKPQHIITMHSIGYKFIP